MKENHKKRLIDLEASLMSPSDDEQPSKKLKGHSIKKKKAIKSAKKSLYQLEAADKKTTTLPVEGRKVKFW